MGRRKQDENGIVDVVFALWGWARVATPLQACVGGAIALVVLSFIIPALISALAADAPNTTAGPNVMVALAHFFSVVFALAGLFGGGGCFLIAASNAMSRDTGLPSEEVGVKPTATKAAEPTHRTPQSSANSDTSRPFANASYRCIKCTRRVTDSVAEACLANPSSFGGRVYCEQCQKSRYALASASCNDNTKRKSRSTRLFSDLFEPNSGLGTSPSLRPQGWPER